MQVDYLIIGQGICGTMLSWFLYKEGKTFAVIDDGDENIPSKLAAGIINPVTGRRYAYTWMIDEVMPFAVQTYEEMGLALDSHFVFEKNIIDFFPSAQMRNAFIDRLEEDDRFLHTYPDQNRFNQFFQYDFGCGLVSPAYLVHMQILMASWRKKLFDLHSLVEEKFISTELHVGRDKVSYKDLHAEKIIFCEGPSAMENNWFSLLPFALNKGEALIIEAEEMPQDHIFKKGLMLAPLPVRNTFWVGSNYLWEFKDDQPTEAFHRYATTVLNSWLKKNYKVLFHKSSLRPATLERRPFVGFHPVFGNVGILNGMGTKGASLAPYFANQLVQHLVHGFPIAGEADVKRFTRILMKS